jgi:hypothetical protein
VERERPHKQGGQDEDRRSLSLGPSRARADSQAVGVNDGEDVVPRQDDIQNQKANEELGLQEVKEGASTREAQPDGRHENADCREGDEDAASHSPERELTEPRRDERQERRGRRGSDEGHGDDLGGIRKVSLPIPSADWQCRASLFGGPSVSIRGAAPVRAGFDRAVWPFVFVTNDRSLLIVGGRCWMCRSDGITGDESALAGEATPRVVGARRHARRGQLRPRRAGLAIARFVAWLAHADAGVDTNGIAHVQCVAVAGRPKLVGWAHPDAGSHHHRVCRADGPPNASSVGEPNPTSHAPADSTSHDATHASADRDAHPGAAGREQADPARLAHHRSDRFDLRHGRSRR